MALEDQLFRSLGEEFQGGELGVQSSPVSYPVPSAVFFPAYSQIPFPDPFVPLETSHPYGTLMQTAVQRLQRELLAVDWQHNFGLPEILGERHRDKMVIGKMFGVLLVKSPEGRLGYLAAFSGKCAGVNHIDGFVPPVFDMLQEGGHFGEEGLRINALNTVVDDMEALIKLGGDPVAFKLQWRKTWRSVCDLKAMLDEEVLVGDLDIKAVLRKVKTIRKERSLALQHWLFDQYAFLNAKGQKKALRSLFDGRPPAGAGECAGPKLLHWAFLHAHQPLALSEFWWGASPKSEQREHAKSYPACEEKCRPILTHMLDGIK